ncbi:hypothetical protein WR25_21063 [Diploscapter pachys]|uniref:Ig-like domain-containing protein n=1 Tax=Diploscapter pachys TaxID=2018661 RepID=A0A2A2KFB4_9BILA|nr:hypothetical protein WR25_21063 [Diploscapter pachys]
MQKQVFKSSEKIWTLNDSYLFPATHITFIDSNRSLEFQSLAVADSGEYKCCVRDTRYAYQSYNCYVTQLTVLPEMPKLDAGSESVPTSTAAPLPPGWNYLLESDNTICADDKNSYFIRIFVANVTSIDCLLEGNSTAGIVQAGNHFPDPVYNDIFIREFNPLVHSGMYTCNGTYQEDNSTFSEQVVFEMRPMQQCNDIINAAQGVQLSDQIVAPILSSLCHSKIIHSLLFAFIVLSLLHF